MLLLAPWRCFDPPNDATRWVPPSQDIQRPTSPRLRTSFVEASEIACMSRCNDPRRKSIARNTSSPKKGTATNFGWLQKQRKALTATKLSQKALLRYTVSLDQTRRSPFSCRWSETWTSLPASPAGCRASGPSSGCSPAKAVVRRCLDCEDESLRDMEVLSNSSGLEVHSHAVMSSDSKPVSWQRVCHQRAEDMNPPRRRDESDGSHGARGVAAMLRKRRLWTMDLIWLRVA